MTREELRSLRVKQIEGWAASGLTQRAYCERESISLKTFSRWRRMLREASPARERPVRLIPVRITRAREHAEESRISVGRTAALSGPVEVVLGSARRVRFVDGLDEASLARLIRLLEVLPC